MRVFDSQFLAPSLKELHLLDVIVVVKSFNLDFVKVIDKQELIAEIGVDSNQ